MRTHGSGLDPGDEGFAGDTHFRFPVHRRFRLTALVLLVCLCGTVCTAWCAVCTCVWGGGGGVGEGLCRIFCSPAATPLPSLSPPAKMWLLGEDGVELQPLLFTACLGWSPYCMQASPAGTAPARTAGSCCTSTTPSTTRSFPPGDCSTPPCQQGIPLFTQTPTINDHYPSLFAPHVHTDSQSAHRFTNNTCAYGPLRRPVS